MPAMFRRRQQLRIDELGVRALPSASPVSLASGVLVIRGTADPDDAAVEANADDSSRIDVTLNGETTSFDRALVRKVFFVGGAEDDTFENSTDLRSLIRGGDGNDLLIGGSGADTIFGGRGDDEIDGGDGNDVLAGEVGDDLLSGGSGDDTLVGADGDDWLDAGDGADRLAGGAGQDDLDGGAGIDVLSGGLGDDWCVGGAGNDRVLGAGGDDELSGGLGDDFLDGGTGSDRVWGGLGDDSCTGGTGFDLVDGGAGLDRELSGESHGSPGSWAILSAIGNPATGLASVESFDRFGMTSTNVELAVVGATPETTFEVWIDPDGAGPLDAVPVGAFATDELGYGALEVTAQAELGMVQPGMAVIELTEGGMVALAGRLVSTAETFYAANLLMSEELGASWEGIAMAWSGHVSVQIVEFDPDTEYTVLVNGQTLGHFTTNSDGAGAIELSAGLPANLNGATVTILDASGETVLGGALSIATGT